MILCGEWARESGIDIERSHSFVGYKGKYSMAVISQGTDMTQIATANSLQKILISNVEKTVSSTKWHWENW